MDILLIELVLWAGLLFLFWALKDGLERVETEIQSTDPAGAGFNIMAAASRPVFVRPTAVDELVGHYRDTPIYRYARVGSQQYQFDYVLPDLAALRLNEDQCVLEPGLVYVRCSEPAQEVGVPGSA